MTRLVVEKYEDTIYFMVEIDHFFLEVVELRMSWIMPIGYEVHEGLLIEYYNSILK